MTETIRYSLIGAQDVRFGTGTFEVTLADGRVVILEAINASHIPGDTVNETVDATQTDVYRARRGMTTLLDFDQNDATTSGLTWGYTQGMNADGTGIEAAGTVTLTANSTNYVEWDPETGAISVNTSAFSPTDKVPIRKLVTNASTITTNTDVRPIWRQNASAITGQCYLAWTSTSAITLLPLNGNLLLINGTAQTIPSAGVALSNSGLSISTTYNIYAYMNAGTMTLEASVTGHSTSTTTGVEVKTGDETRSYVGTVDVTGGGNFDTDIRSWFIPPFYRFATSGGFSGIFMHSNTADRTYTLPDVTAYVLLNTTASARIEYGTVTIAATGAQPSHTQQVNFTTSFAVAPKVFIAASNNAGSAETNVGSWRSHTPTTTSFQSVVSANDGATNLQNASYTASWFAIGL